MRRISGSVRCALAALLVAGGFSVASGCRKTSVPTEVPEAPSVRLYFVSTVAGALEPCGCRKDMLGGVDHAAAFITSRLNEAPRRLLLSTGPLFFQDPALDAERREQDVWKAQALAASFAQLGLAAFAPGINDFAAGVSGLRDLVAPSGVKAVGANVALPELAPTAVFQVGDYKVGVAGIAAVPEALAAGSDPAIALEAAAAELAKAGAQIKVALIAASRGEALRLLERVGGFDVAAIGKASDQGDANDAASPPTLVGDTLVLQTPNHLQALAYVDLFVEGEGFDFADASRIAELERRESLLRRRDDLKRRAEVALPDSNAERAKAFEAELTRLDRELAELERKAAAEPQPSGSFFRYHLAEVREGAGSDPKVAERMLEYYRRVNEHNRVALADRVPAPAPSGTARYMGGSVCASCHEDATTFWQGTGHASAYATLSTQFKEFNLDCVGCHVTGYGRPGGSTVTHVDRLKDVQCEACHGPGSRHVEGGGNTDLITLTPAESACRSCHHAPHVADDWDLKQAWSHIVGPGHGAALPPTKSSL
jgi:hypothetical protein